MSDLSTGASSMTSFRSASSTVTSLGGALIGPIEGRKKPPHGVRQGGRDTPVAQAAGIPHTHGHQGHC
eukprot:6131451-Pyramimonas_sp.AAC.1